MFKKLTILLAALLVSCGGAEAPSVNDREVTSIGGFSFIPVEPIITYNSVWNVVDTMDVVVKINMGLTLTHGEFTTVIDTLTKEWFVVYRHLPEMNVDSIRGIVVQLESRKARRDSVGN